MSVVLKETKDSLICLLKFIQKLHFLKFLKNSKVQQISPKCKIFIFLKFRDNSESKDLMLNHVKVQYLYWYSNYSIRSMLVLLDWA